MPPSAPNLEVPPEWNGLRPPASILQTQRFAAARLPHVSRQIASGLPLGQGGHAAARFAEAQASRRLRTGRRAWATFERLLARRSDLRLARWRPRFPHALFSSARPSVLPVAQALFRPARSDSPPPQELARVTHQTIYSFVTLTLPFRAPEAASAPLLPGSSVGAPVPALPSLFAKSPQQIEGNTPASSRAAAAFEPRPWRDRAPLTASLPLSRPPVPQASWLGISPTAPPQAERERSVPSVLPLFLPPVLLLPPAGPVTRSAAVLLPELVYGTRAFVTRPLVERPASVSGPAPLLSAPAALVPEAAISPRASFLPSVTRLLAVTAALSLVQMLPTLRPVSAFAAPRQRVSAFSVRPTPRQKTAFQPVLPGPRLVGQVPTLKPIPFLQAPGLTLPAQAASLPASHLAATLAFVGPVGGPLETVPRMAGPVPARRQPGKQEQGKRESQPLPSWERRTAPTPEAVWPRFTALGLTRLKPRVVAAQELPIAFPQAHLQAALPGAEIPPNVASRQGALSLARTVPAATELRGEQTARGAVRRIPLAASRGFANLAAQPWFPPPLLLFTRRVSEREQTDRPSAPNSGGARYQASLYSPPLVVSEGARRGLSLPSFNPPRIGGGGGDLLRVRVFNTVSAIPEQPERAGAITHSRRATEAAASVAVSIGSPQRLRRSSLALTQAAYVAREGETAAELPARVRMAPSQAMRTQGRQTPDLETVVADVIVQEFQPQLLTVVRDFLAALWNTVQHSDERPEAVSATAVPQAAAPWLPVLSGAAPLPAMSFGSTPGDRSALFSGSPAGPTLLPPGLAWQVVPDLTVTPKPPTERTGVRPAAPLAVGLSARPRTRVRQTRLAPEGALPARREGPAEVLPLAARALPMTLPVAPQPPTPAEDHWRVQRATSGEPSAAPAGSASHQQSVNLASQEKGAAANDVHLLANEVWSLLKRKLETESERLGRR